MAKKLIAVPETFSKNEKILFFNKLLLFLFFTNPRIALQTDGACFRHLSASYKSSADGQEWPFNILI